MGVIVCHAFVKTGGVSGSTLAATVAETDGIVNFLTKIARLRRQRFGGRALVRGTVVPKGLPRVGLGRQTYDAHVGNREVHRSSEVPAGTTEILGRGSAPQMTVNGGAGQTESENDESEERIRKRRRETR